MWYQNSADVESVQASGYFSEDFWLCFSLVVPRECGLFLCGMRYYVCAEFFHLKYSFCDPLDSAALGGCTTRLTLAVHPCLCGYCMFI
jgi:hypothetical protein